MFPIYDKYASAALNIFAGGEAWPKNCRDYARYRKTIQEVFRGHSFEAADIYLWLYGLREALRAGRKDVNGEVRELFSAEPNLFRAIG